MASILILSARGLFWHLIFAECDLDFLRGHCGHRLWMPCLFFCCPGWSHHKDLSEPHFHSKGKLLSLGRGKRSPRYGKFSLWNSILSFPWKKEVLIISDVFIAVRKEKNHQYISLLYYIYIVYYRCIQSSPVAQYVWLFLTPWTAARQASLSITNLRSLLKLVSIKSEMPSNHLILCYPFFLLPSTFPCTRVFPMNQFFASGGQSIWVLASVLPVNIQDWFPLGWTGLISL